MEEREETYGTNDLAGLVNYSHSLHDRHLDGILLGLCVRRPASRVGIWYDWGIRPLQSAVRDIVINAPTQQKQNKASTKASFSTMPTIALSLR